MALSAAGWLVGGFLIFGFGLMSWVSNNIERRNVIIGIAMTVIGGSMFVWGFLGLGPEKGLTDIPRAFIEVLAWVMGR